MLLHADASTATAFIKAAVQEFGKVDVFVSNAGICGILIV